MDDYIPEEILALLSGVNEFYYRGRRLSARNHPVRRPIEDVEVDWDRLASVVERQTRQVCD